MENFTLGLYRETRRIFTESKMFDKTKKKGNQNARVVVKVVHHWDFLKRSKNMTKFIGEQTR